jgi:hypothetical protein
MEENRTKLSLEKSEAGEFVLRKTPPDGADQQLILSEVEVVFLARLFPQVARQISANKSRSDKGLSAFIAVPVTNYKIGSDLHQQSVMLRLTDEAEQTLDFSLTPQMAANIGSDLVSWADKVGSAPPPVRQ